MFKMNSWKKPRFFDLPIFQVERPAQGEAEMSLQEIFESAKHLVDQGMTGDVQAVKKALEVLEDLRKRIEVNHLVEAYYGSALVLLGQEDRNSPENSERVTDGLRILDKAVSNAPDNPQISALRSSVRQMLQGAVAETAVEEGNDPVSPVGLTESDSPPDLDPRSEQGEMDNRQDFAEWDNAWGDCDLTEFEGLQENDQDPFAIPPEDNEDEMEIDVMDTGDTREMSEERQEESATGFADDSQKTQEPKDFGLNPWERDTQAEWDIPSNDDAEHRGDDWVQGEQEEFEGSQDEEVQPAEPVKSARETFLEGFRLYDLALAGDREATRAALELWEGIYLGNPEDTTAQAYYGGCLTLEARNNGINEMTFRNTVEGLKLVNRAVEKDPGNLRLRYLRAYLTYKAPDDTFRMNEVAIEDFTSLKQSYEEDNQSFDTELYYQILYDLGLAYERANEPEQAKEVWSKLLQECQDPKYKELLERKL